MPKGLEANEDVEAYFTVFERAATTLNLPQKKWGPQLMKLFGMDLRDAPLQDLGYDIVKDNLRCQASEAERQWQVNFTMASFDSMKGPRELGQELVEAAMHWLKPERRSAAEVVQLVALHQFLTLLPGTVSDWVAQHQPKDMEEGIGLAEHFLGNRHNEEYGGSDKKVVAWQYSTTCSTDEPSSSLAYDQ